MKFPVRIIIIFSTILFPLFVFARALEYTPLQSVKMPNGGDFYNANILEYLANIYILAIALAGGLAVVRIVYAGIKYMTSDIYGLKTQAKKDINAAVVGLLMILGIYIFLYTLNPNLVKMHLQIQPTKMIQGSGVEIYDWPKSNPVLASFYNPAGGNAAQAIAAAAQYAKDNPMANTECSVTNNGRTACVYTVDQIVKSATGVSPYAGLDIPGLDNALRNNSNYEYVGTDLTALQNGDIVVSNNGNLRHTGVVVNGEIYNNDSNASEASGGKIIIKSSNPTNWQNYFGSTNVYRPK